MSTPTIEVEERARLLGRVLMAVSVLQLLLFLRGVKRHSYAALALPVLGVLTAISALAFWVGYTMATTRFGDAPDYPSTPTPSNTSEQTNAAS